MRALKVLVVVMGVMIIAGVVGLVVVATRRVVALPPPGVRTVMDEPAGTRMVGLSALPDRLAVQLQGGGPDRVVVIDLRNGRVLGRAELAR
jgi:Family of unknown function (DUF6476)